MERCRDSVSASRKLFDPVGVRLFVHMIGAALSRCGRRKNNYRREATQQPHVPISNLFRQMLGDVKTDCDVILRPREHGSRDVLLDVKFCYDKASSATIMQPRIGVFDARDKISSLAKSS